jgi:hypothetical protein
MTVNDGAFANQATAKAKQAAMMARLLNNLANAALQKNDTVAKLVTANKKLVNWHHCPSLPSATGRYLC